MGHAVAMRHQDPLRQQAQRSCPTNFSKIALLPCRFNSIGRSASRGMALSFRLGCKRGHSVLGVHRTARWWPDKALQAPDGVQFDNDHPSGPVSRSACSPSVNRSHRLVKTHSLIPQVTRFCPRQRPECLSVETSPRWLSGASVRPARPKTSRRTHSRAVHDFEIPPRRLPRNLQRAQRLHDTHLSLSFHPCTNSWQALQQGLPTVERRYK